MIYANAWSNEAEVLSLYELRMILGDHSRVVGYSAVYLLKVNMKW